MITEQNFRDIMDTDLEVDDQKYGHTDIDKISKGHASKKCFELAKQLAIDFAIWINKHPLQFQTTVSDTWIGLDLIYYTTEELFELFLNSTPNGK